MKAHESLKETLSFYGVQCNEPYYISSGNPVFEELASPIHHFTLTFVKDRIC